MKERDGIKEIKEIRERYFVFSLFFSIYLLGVKDGAKIY